MPLGWKRYINEDGVERGRLEVGYMRQGLGYAYYEPVDDGDPNDPPDRGPEIGIYFESRGYKTKNKKREPKKGSVERWSAQLSDVTWHPWAKPFPGESSTKGGGDIIQRRDLYDYYCYLMATDPADVAERAEGLDVPGKMRRLAFYNLASPWKRKEMKERKAKAKLAGIAVQDVVLSDVEDEDEGFEADEEEKAERRAAKKRKHAEMAPPPRPEGPANKKKKKAKAAAGGSGHRDKERQRNNDDRFDGLFVASGGASGFPSNSAQAGSSRQRSVSVLGGPGREASYDSESWDAAPPQGYDDSSARFDRPFHYVRTTVESVIDSGEDEAAMRRRAAELNGGDIDDNAAVERIMRETSVQAEQQGLDQFANGCSGSGYGTGRGPSKSGHGQRAAGATDYEAYNGGLTYEDAIQLAREQSTAPEFRPPSVRGSSGLPSDDELNEWVGRSKSPGERAPPQGSIVGDDENEPNDTHAETGDGKADSQSNVSGEPAHTSGENKDDAEVDQARIKREQAGDGEEQVEGENGEACTSGENGEANDENGVNGEANVENGKNNGDEVDEGLGVDGN